MKAELLASEFTRIFTADAAFANVLKREEQSIALLPQAVLDFQGTRLVFEVRVTPLDAAGRILSYALGVVVESSASDVTGSDHAAWAALVQKKFFGAQASDLATTKAAMAAAMSAGGKFTLRNFDCGAAETIDPTVENGKFRTVVPVHGIALVTGSL